jgi:hypothetical protein
MGRVAARIAPRFGFFGFFVTPVVCFSLGCRQSEHRQQTADSSTQTTIAEDADPSSTRDSSISSLATTGEIPAASTPAVLAKLDAYMIDCAGARIDLKTPIQEIAAALTADSLLYNKKPLSDCSGIFHRVLKAMKQRCAGYDFPAIEKYRDTRDLARWYHERGDLILVHEALRSADLIKPGAVMFYGHRDTLYANFTVEQLLSPRGIEHMGVVVAVDKDATGQATGYELFHGQTYGKFASTTKHPLRKPTRPGLPPFGNWNQQWVAFARLLNPSRKQSLAR